MFTLSQIAKAIGGTAVGNTEVSVAATAEPAAAGASDLALASEQKYADALKDGQAKAALLWVEADWEALGLEGAILAPRPRHAMSSLTAIFDADWRNEPAGVHPTAIIHESVHLGADCAIGPFVVLAEGVVIEDGARVAAHCSVGRGSRIGAQATLREGVRILHGVTIGDRFVAQPGAVIGGDGFSFVTPEPSNAEAARASLGEASGDATQAWARIHSLGGVEIGDDVEVGANACIDRGTIRATVIGSGTKVDNLVQVGHNVRTGRNCLLCGHVGIAGSVDLGDNVVLGGAVSVADNLKIGDGVVAGFGTKILSTVPAGRIMMGYPAVQMQTHVDTYKATRRLPRLLADVAALKKAVLNPGSND